MQEYHKVYYFDAFQLVQEIKSTDNYLNQDPMPSVETNRLSTLVRVILLALICLIQDVNAERKKCFTGLGGMGR